MWQYHVCTSRCQVHKKQYRHTKGSSKKWKWNHLRVQPSLKQQTGEPLYDNENIELKQCDMRYFRVRFFNSWCISSISSAIALNWIPQNLTDDYSSLLQIMAQCRHSTSHYLKQFWPNHMTPYCVIRPQGAEIVIPVGADIHWWPATALWIF